MFNKKKSLDKLIFNDRNDILLILENINDSIIKEKILNLGKFAFMYFSNEQKYYVIKNTDDDKIRELAIDSLIFNSSVNEHFFYLEKLANEIPESYNFIKNNFDDILYYNQSEINSNNVDDKYNLLTGIDEELLYDKTNTSYYYELIPYIEKNVKDKEKLETYIINNIEYLINNCVEIESLLNFFNKSEIIKNNYNILNNNFDLIVAKLLRSSVSELEQEKLLTIYKLLVKELLNRENINLNDIKYIDNGYFCYVYQFGDLVVKFGENITSKNIPKHPRIIRPIIRKHVSDKRYLEIQYPVECKDFSTDDVYKLYRELRDDGIVWIDCKRKNMGLLTKENINAYREIEAVDSAIGFVDKNHVNDRILQPGDYVVMDNDLLFYEDELNLDELSQLNIDLSNYYNYEKVYQNELSKRKRGLK